MHDLLSWLTPLRVLAVAAGLVAVGAVVSVVAPGVGRRGLGFVAGLPPVVSLTLVVALAASFRIVLGLDETTPRVLGDELIYADLAKSFALQGQPLLRGDLHLGHSLLYPLFAAPAYALGGDGVKAFSAVKVENSIAMALTAVPAYFLARRVVSHAWSVGVAALTVAAPWLVYTALMLTEPLFYLLVTTFALVVVRMLERPTWRRQLVVLLLLAVLVGVRAQALALVVALLLVLVADAVARRSLRRTAETYAVTLFTLGLALAATAFVAAAGVPLPQEAYGSLLDRGYSLPSVLAWASRNLAAFGLGLGVVALAAFPLALAGLLRRDASGSERAVGITALALFVAILLSVALLSASPFGLDRLHERSLFYVTPLILVCFAHWLARGLSRPAIAAAAAAVCVVALAASLGGGLLDRTSAVDSPTGVFLHAWPRPDSTRFWAIALALAGAAVLVLARRPLVPLLTVFFAFVAVGAASDLRGELTPAQAHGLAWVDRALPRGATAALVHVAFPLDPGQPCAADARDQQQSFVVWTEFANARIDRVAHVYGPVGRDGIDSPQLEVAPGGVLLDKGRPYRAAYVVVDSRQPVVGRRLGRLDEVSLGESGVHSGSLTLWKVDPPLRLAPAQGKVPPRADGRGC